MSSLHYSHLGESGDPVVKSWNNIVLTPTTIARRKQIQSGMDDFTSFTWRGVDAFDVFGAFIINNKNTLKFYNGPSFSNQYTKPQFESAAGQLTGVSFNVQKIDFTIGVYWISEEDYRKLIDWLNPYEISSLTFGFEKKYYYLVKLASIGDATRHIVGIETVNGESQYRYYTEMKLTFEVQGDPCAYQVNEYEFDVEENPNTSSSAIDSGYHVYEFNKKTEASTQTITELATESDLAMPFKLYMHIKLDSVSSVQEDVFLECNSYYKYNDSDEDILDQRLFKVDLTNLTFSSAEYKGTKFLDLIYDSNSGLIYWVHADGQIYLLSRLSTVSSGSRLVKSLESNSYKVPGTFDRWDFTLNKWKLKLKITGLALDKDCVRDYMLDMRARTNLI